MMQFLQSNWTAAGVGAIAYALTTWLSLQPQEKIARAAADARSRGAFQWAGSPGPSWSFQNPEMQQLLGELKKERDAVRLRASQLDELETRLNAERQEICVVTQSVSRLRAELDTTIVRVSEAEAVNLKKLAKVYATMSPGGAANILKEMEDDQVVRILALMKETETAPILEGMAQGKEGEAKRAALISNRLRLALVETKKVAAP